MRVNDPNLSAAALNANGAGGVSGAGKTAQLDPLKISTGGVSEAGKGPKADSVELSSLSSKINELQSGSLEREAYLEKLGAEVAAGTYEPDPAETSRKLVEEALAKPVDA